jgi:UDP-N-acetyl-D-mannosaminuronic acid dehydrogenase
MSKQRVCVVGLGEIGGSVFRALGDHTDKIDLYGVDINPVVFDKYVDIKYAGLTTDLPEADVYLICVWNIEQIMDTLEEIGYMERSDAYDPLIVIESTIDMSRFDDLLKTIMEVGLEYLIATFPHRWNPGDPDHAVFNQPRVLGAGRPEALKRAHEFYAQFMDEKNIHLTDFWTAAASKVCENAYRFVEIVLAQELCQMVEGSGRSFARLREAMNTKWNIDVREARDGVRGKCLPKDMAIFNRFFSDNMMYKMAEFSNEKHKELFGSST